MVAPFLDFPAPDSMREPMEVFPANELDSPVGVSGITTPLSFGPCLSSTAIFDGSILDLRLTFIVSSVAEIEVKAADVQRVFPGAGNSSEAVAMILGWGLGVGMGVEVGVGIRVGAGVATAAKACSIIRPLSTASTFVRVVVFPVLIFFFTTSVIPAAPVLFVVTDSPALTVIAPLPVRSMTGLDSALPRETCVCPARVASIRMVGLDAASSSDAMVILELARQSAVLPE